MQMLRKIMLAQLCAALAALRAPAYRYHPSVLRAPRLIALESGAPAGGGMVDGARIGPPPDMPSLLLNNRIVYLGMPINSQVAELIIGELLYLQYDAPTKPVIMYINSPGTTTEDGMPVGFETEAFAIADTMAYVEAPIRTVLVGKAYGLAAMLLACGEKGQRSALCARCRALDPTLDPRPDPHSSRDLRGRPPRAWARRPYGTVMLHQPRGQMARGQASDIAIKAREVLTNRRTALEIMGQATGVSLEKLAEDTNRCLYLDAEAAKDYGIVDNIVSKSDAGAPASLLDGVSSLSRGIG